MSNKNKMTMTECFYNWAYDKEEDKAFLFIKALKAGVITHNAISCSYEWESLIRDSDERNEPKGRANDLIVAKHQCQRYVSIALSKMGLEMSSCPRRQVIALSVSDLIDVEKILTTSGWSQRVSIYNADGKSGVSIGDIKCDVNNYNKTLELNITLQELEKIKSGRLLNVMTVSGACEFGIYLDRNVIRSEIL